YEDVTPARHGRPGAFVTVQRGCDHRCTFCIVPFTRGPERSRAFADVVREVEALAARGTTEVTLLGQTVNSYRTENGDFADLLKAVAAVTGIRRVRFTSPHPNDFADRVIRAMNDVEEVCEHVHLPVQSGSTRVLKRMLRRYDRDGFLKCVDRLRSAIPGLAITTDIIVGFPGETDDDFADTLSLVEEVEFDDAFTFKYSLRDGTPATKLKDRVLDSVAGERLERLIAAVRAKSRARNVRLVGTSLEVLYEKVARRGRGLLQGRTRTNKVVLVERPAESVGSYERVRLTGTTGSTFSGVPAMSRQLTVVP
ncbi:MAG: MiaB/RimO family radical SAM methylthiotransferase, partial [Gemmatimonadales bacterium]